MKYSYLVLALFLSVLNPLIAQENEENVSKVKLGFTIGPSIPTGDFGSEYVNRSSAGLAKIGFNLEGNLQYGLSDYFGLIGHLRFSSNGVKTNLIEDDLSKSYRGVYFDVDANIYITIGMLTGMYGMIPFNANKTSFFQMKGMCGLVNSIFPEITVDSHSGGLSMDERYSSASDIAIAFLIGGGFHFKIDEKVTFMINMDYHYTHPDFEDIRYEVDFSNGDSYVDESDHDQLMETINIGIGLAFNL